MATTEITPNATGNGEQVDVTFDNMTLALVKTGVDEAGKDVKEVKPENKAKEMAEKGEAEIAGIQTFKVPVARTVEGARSIAGSDEELLNMFNNGMSIKLRNRAYSLLGETDENNEYVFEFTESYDLSEEARRPTGRRSANPVDKILKLTQGLSEEQKAQLRALIGA